MDRFEDLVIKVVDKEVEKVGAVCKAVLYSCVAPAMNLRDAEIPRPLRDLSSAIVDVFSVERKKMVSLLAELLCVRMGVDYDEAWAESLNKVLGGGVSANP
jgi:hypothetical protein